MSHTAQALREVLYQLPHGMRLSAMPHMPASTLLAGPVIGGALLGLFTLALALWRKTRARHVIDPIEANALYGGRMSLRDSVYVCLQNVISNAGGASVGLEAGYTQIAGGLASRFGVAFELRRSDLRTLVGCGSAAAIAAAFGSPLTGAFYAYELVIGTYTIATLTPVIVAALCGSLVSQTLVAEVAFVDVSQLSGIAGTQITGIATLPCIVLGLICAMLGIAVMRSVTLVEKGFAATRLSNHLRPAIGGICVGALAALTTPQVLSGGHGALHMHLSEEGLAIGAGALAGLFAAKAAASAISIGAGFRGGLFFASLFLGVLAGKVFAALLPLLLPGTLSFGLSPLVYAVIGMGALAVAIVGGPLTMTFLALEMTGSFPLAGLVLVSVIASSLTVRMTFGYSFATWRFHLRGESIRSAHDVGWFRNLTVARLMHKEVRPVSRDMPLALFLREYPLGSASLVVLVDAEEHYAGIVLVPEAHALATKVSTEATLAAIARYRDDFLLPAMNAKEAVAAFDRLESEALAVVESDGSRKVLGFLTESYTLKRYSDELEQQRRSMIGGSV